MKGQNYEDKPAIIYSTMLCSNIVFFGKVIVAPIFQILTDQILLLFYPILEKGTGRMG